MDQSIEMSKSSGLSDSIDTSEQVQSSAIDQTRL